MNVFKGGKAVTLKEKIRQIRPDAIDPRSLGGVSMCPNNYPELAGHYSYRICVVDDNASKGCDECWNQEFIEHKEGKTVTLKDKIREVHPYDIAADADYYKSYGGVYKCVHDYTILKGCYEKLECNGDFRHRKNFQCEECWKQEYIPIENGAESEPEQVDHPAHYIQPGRRECIEEMRVVFGDEAVRQWCIITAYKYRYRTGKKTGNSADQDNSKAEWYLNYAEKLRKEHDNVR